MLALALTCLLGHTLASEPAPPPVPQIRQYATWKKSIPKPGSPWSAYLKEPTPELLRFLAQENEHQKFAGKPSPVTLPESFKKDLLGALAKIPEPFGGFIRQNLAAIFVVKNLGSSAYTNDLLDPMWQTQASFVVLDFDALQRKANAWASWKENSPFKPEKGWTLEAQIAPPALDNREHALLFILLHEFGHVIGSYLQAHPDYSGMFDPDPMKYPFSGLSWRGTGDPEREGYQVEHKKFPNPRPKPALRFYANAADKIPLSRAPEYYRFLETSDFFSLYGTTNPSDDFAEAFTLFFYQELLRLPYKITVRKNGKAQATYQGCVEGPRCLEKRKFLNKMIQEVFEAADKARGRR
jgi:hypothetical protein